MCPPSISGESIFTPALAARGTPRKRHSSEPGSGCKSLKSLAFGTISYGEGDRGTLGGQVGDMSPRTRWGTDKAPPLKGSRVFPPRPQPMTQCRKRDSTATLPVIQTTARPSTLAAIRGAPFSAQPLATIANTAGPMARCCAFRTRAGCRLTRCTSPALRNGSRRGRGSRHEPACSHATIIGGAMP